MILQALYEYYQRKATDPDSNIAPRGYEKKDIPFIIVIDGAGNFVNLEDTREADGKNRRARSFLVHKTKGRSGAKSYETANILWDHFGYVLAHPKDGTEKAATDAAKQHATFAKVVGELAEKFPANESLKAVSLFLASKEQKERVFSHPTWEECKKKDGTNLSFRLVGQTEIIAEHPDLKLLVEEDSNEDSLQEVSNGICLITGKYGPVKILHTATSLPGGKSGGKLVGFQKNSGYDSYYKEQGTNAPVSVEAEDAYTTTLNVLLGKDSTNKLRLSDTTILFWAEKAHVLEEKFPLFFANPDKDNPDRNSQEVKALFESVHSGKLNNGGETRFYILGIAPNAARISVRFWRTGTVSEVATQIAQHFTDLEMVKQRKDDHEYFTLFNLLTNIAFDYKVDNLQPNLAAAIFESAIGGTPYPATLQQQCLRRIKAEQHVGRIRAAILKAYLNRKNRISTVKEKDIEMALDVTNTNQGYLCGRLFAVLEKIQEEAQPGINSTIKDRYYGAASSTPVTVFGRLLGLSNHHLAKLNPGRKVNFEKLIQEVIAEVSSKGMPAHLSLDDQSRFAIGYYHQRQHFFIAKESNN